ncbi:MAG TPA: hypothetical protein VN512_13235 [Clostridia bacterium]|nr:hypothetical protein [Clostridia bacterium]
MGDVFCTTDPRGYVIHLEESRWEEHIKADHSVMNNNVGAIEETVNKPEFIFESSKIPDRQVYFKRATGTTYSSEYYTKVIVKIDPIIPHGQVVTAFPTEDVCGGIGAKIYGKD